MAYMISGGFIIAAIGLLMLLREKSRAVQKQERQIRELKQELKSFHGADAEQRKGEIKELANIIHLYASLSEEETQSPSLKEKQRIIQKTAEELLQIAEK